MAFVVYRNNVPEIELSLRIISQNLISKDSQHFA